MDVMDFFDNCTDDSVVFDALEHEYYKLLEGFKKEVHLCYEVFSDDNRMQNICQKTIKLHKEQLRKLKSLMNYIQSIWEE